MGSSFYSDSGLTSTEQDSIESAIAAAETAQSAAETAKADAETAKTNAETAEVNAETAQTAAEAAQTAAETAQVNAGNSASASATSATQSASSATSSASSASTASTKASEASVSAANALASANNSSSSASSSATSAAESATSATASASSATSAAASLSTFQNQYLGASASAPTQDPDGSALDLGDLYFDTSANVMKVYSDSGWTNASSSVNGTSERQTYTATAGQTTFSVTYDAGYVDVWLNGAKLLAGTDFTATSGTDIVLASGAASGDIVDIIAFGTFVFTSNDHYTKTQSDARYEPIDTAYTKAESDARYVELSGDTITGDLTVNGNLNVAGTTVTIDSANAQTVDLGDNDKIRLGDGDDLQIYHDGSHSYIKDSGTGDLLVLANKFIVKSASGASSFIQADPSATDVKLFFGNVEKLATTSTGVDVTGTLTADDITLSDADTPTITLTDTTNTLTTFLQSGNSTGVLGTSTAHALRIQANSNDAIRVASGGDISFYEDTGTTAKLFWDASNESLQIGTTSAPVNTHCDLFISSAVPLIEMEDSDTNAYARMYVSGSSFYLDADHSEAGANTTLNLRVDDELALTIDSNQNVGIGTSSVSFSAGSGLRIERDATATLRLQDTGSHGFEIRASSSAAEFFSANSKPYTFETGGSERMRLNSSGNLLVGKTNDADSGTGVRVRGDGLLQATRQGSDPISANRTNSDGDVIAIRRDGSLVGSIGANGGYIYAGSGNVNLRFHNGADAILPATSGGASRDNVIDMGSSGARFDDIYATNGTIQTSDEREKQQIASLTDAEMTAAKAISKLFKTFKWNDKVEAKGDNARTHTGVIAQQVETAMSDAGLDAGNYAFFISTTWWEADGETYNTQEEAPEGATERNRKGIRYPELLSFIGAATEQRLTNIETRLEALEAN